MASPSKPLKTFAQAVTAPPSSLSSLSAAARPKTQAPTGPSPSATPAYVTVEQLTSFGDELLRKFVSLQQLPPPPSSEAEVKESTSSSGGLMSKLAAASGFELPSAAGVKAVPGALPDPSRALDDDGEGDEPSGAGKDKVVVSTALTQYRNVVANYQGKFVIWHQMYDAKWKDNRARHESRTLCHAMDRLVLEGLKPGDSEAFEILACRLAAIIVINDGKVKNVHTVASQLEYQSQDVMVPHDTLVKAMKTSKLMEQVGGGDRDPQRAAYSKSKSASMAKKPPTKKAGGAAPSEAAVATGRH